MHHRVRLGLLGLVAVVLAVVAFAVGGPTPADAATYSAGIERAASHICRCPVLAGGCVCEYSN